MRKLLQRVTAWFRKLDHEMEERVVRYLAEQAARRARADGLCGLCDHQVEPGEDTYWSDFYGGPVHCVCVPAWIEALGQDALRIFLREGPQPVMDAIVELTDNQVDRLQAVGQ